MAQTSLHKSLKSLRCWNWLYMELEEASDKEPHLLPCWMATHTNLTIHQPKSHFFFISEYCLWQKPHQGSRQSLLLFQHIHFSPVPGTVAWSDVHPPGMRMVAGLILKSGKTFFHWDLIMKKYLWPFCPFRWFKKGSCQLLAKEWALSTGKLPRRLAQEQLDRIIDCTQNDLKCVEGP